MRRRRILRRRCRHRSPQCAPLLPRRSDSRLMPRCLPTPFHPAPPLPTAPNPTQPHPHSLTYLYLGALMHMSRRTTKALVIPRPLVSIHCVIMLSADVSRSLPGPLLSTMHHAQSAGGISMFHGNHQQRSATSVRGVTAGRVAMCSRRLRLASPHTRSRPPAPQVAKMPAVDDSADPVAVAVVAQHAEQAVHDAVRCAGSRPPPCCGNGRGTELKPGGSAASTPEPSSAACTLVPAAEPRLEHRTAVR